MTHTDDEMTEAVAKAMWVADPHSGRMDEGITWDALALISKSAYRDMARAAITAVRKHDEQAALNCGHCSEPDEIACACTIKERDDE